MRNESKHKANGLDGRALLAWHKLHVGVYVRVAKTLDVDPSYVSRVASGDRESERVKGALLAELERIQKLRPAR